jgi:hypothetical protein
MRLHVRSRDRVGEKSSAARGTEREREREREGEAIESFVGHTYSFLRIPI